MAIRIIRSIFPEQAQRVREEEERLKRQEQETMRGLFSGADVKGALGGFALGAKAAPDRPIAGGIAGMLGQVARRKFLPTDEEQLAEIQAQAGRAAAQIVNPGVDPLGYQEAVAAELTKMLDTSDNPLLRTAALTATQDVRTKRREAEKANLEMQSAAEKVIQDRAERRQKVAEIKAGERGKKAYGSPELSTYMKDLSTEFNNVVENVQTARGNLAALLSLPQTGAGDYVMISKLVQLASEGMVTDSEFSLASGTGGFIAGLKNTLDSWKTGNSLQPQQRKEIVDVAASLFDMKNKEYQEEFNIIEGKTKAAMLTDTPEQEDSYNSVMASYFGDPEARAVDLSEYLEQAVKYNGGEIEEKPDPDPMKQGAVTTSGADAKRVAEMSQRQKDAQKVLSSLGVIELPEEEDEDNNQ